jgi:type II secretory pathway pseudopilin PulG
MVEMLVAVVLLGVCTSIVLGAVVTGESRADYAKRRELAFALCGNQIANARTLSIGGTLAAGTTVSTSTLPGNIPITVTSVTTLMTGYTNLYQVAVTATWYENAQTRPDYATLSTLVRSPDA